VVVVTVSSAAAAAGVMVMAVMLLMRMVVLVVPLALSARVAGASTRAVRLQSVIELRLSCDECGEQLGGIDRHPSFQILLQQRFRVLLHPCGYQWRCIQRHPLVHAGDSLGMHVCPLCAVLRCACAWAGCQNRAEH
jgi:hypothetical protein